ncbi:MAG: hypothetical protein M3268_04200, partial [Acidobacteriota bacterium]|nr:hypothetical protein [Acidobacteriota bacterium]
EIRVTGWGLIVLALLLAYLFLAAWPSGLSPDMKGDHLQTIYLFGARVSFVVTLDVQLLLVVMLAGALGSFIHAATSFGDFVGNEKLTANWIWWYALRPAIGMALAAVFYLVIRGGFLSTGTSAGQINPYGIAALAGLVGMFSKQVTDKLSEVFDTLFKTAPGEGDAKRKDELNSPLPVVTDIDPTSVEPKTENVVVGVKGSGFVNGSVVRIGGVNRETDYVDQSRLKAKLLPEDVADDGEIELTVFSPGPGGGTSSPIKLRVGPALEQDGAGINAPGRAITPAPLDDESHIDGCDVAIVNPTSDEELPAAQGGVA